MYHLKCYSELALKFHGTFHYFVLKNVMVKIKFNFLLEIRIYQGKDISKGKYLKRIIDR